MAINSYKHFEFFNRTFNKKTMPQEKVLEKMAERKRNR